jgi:uncharacterized protein (DUF433 family)
MLPTMTAEWPHMNTDKPSNRPAKRRLSWRDWWLPSSNSGIVMVVETRLPITVDPEVLRGTPAFRGTRVPVQTLVDYILDGETLETFLHSFPTVKRDDAVRLL